MNIVFDVKDFLDTGETSLDLKSWSISKNESDIIFCYMGENETFKGFRRVLSLRVVGNKDIILEDGFEVKVKVVSKPWDEKNKYLGVVRMCKIPEKSLMSGFHKNATIQWESITANEFAKQTESYIFTSVEDGDIEFSESKKEVCGGEYIFWKLKARTKKGYFIQHQVLKNIEDVFVKNYIIKIWGRPNLTKISMILSKFAFGKEMDYQQLVEFSKQNYKKP